MTEHDTAGTGSVPERIEKHEDTMWEKIDGHVARSEQRLNGAVTKTSETIGKVARFAADHTPEPVATRIEDIADRAQNALDKPHIDDKN